MAIVNSDGSIILQTQVDQSGLKKGMSTMKGGASALASGFGKLGAAVAAAFSVKVLVDFGKEAASLATKTEASVKRLIDIYGSASEAVGDFIDANANALGISKSAAASYASVYGNLFSVWADQETNAKLTTQYLNMTAVVASKTGRTVEDVQERVRSGLLGNTEAIEDLGIFVNVKTIEMTDAFQRMANGKSWEQLDAYTQQQVRSMAILEQATSKYGSEVEQTTALTRSQFQAAWQDFQATFGQLVNVVLMPILEALTDIFNMATNVLQALFNISGKTVSQNILLENTSDNQEDIKNNIEETVEAQKKAIAGFDDIQILTSTTAENTEGVQNIGDFDFEEIIATDKKDTFDTSKIEKFAKDIKSFFEPTKKALEGLWDNLDFDSSDLETTFSNLKDNVFAPFVRYVSERLLPKGLEAISEGLGTIKTAAKTQKPALDNLFNNVIKPLFDDFGRWVDEALESTTELFDEFSNNLEDYQEEIGVFLDIITALLQAILYVLEVSVDGMFETSKEGTKSIMELFFSLLGVVGNVFLAIFELFGALFADINGNSEEAESLMKKVVVRIKNFFIDLINSLIAVVNALWIALAESARVLVNIFGGIIEAIGFLFGKEWDLTWDEEIPTIEYIDRIDPDDPLALFKNAAGVPIYSETEVAKETAKNGTKDYWQYQTPEDKLAEALAKYGFSQNNGSTEVVLELDGREFGRAVVEQGNRENRRIGTRLVIE